MYTGARMRLFVALLRHERLCLSRKCQYKATKMLELLLPGNLALSSTVRIPDDIYQTLRQFKITLEAQHQSAAPTMQDLVTVALERFIEDWNTSDSKEELLNELLEHRQKARSRMGKKKTKSAGN